MKLISIVLFGFSAFAWAKIVRFDMRDVGQRNTAHFVSDAPLEKTLGLSNSIAGWIELDTERIADGLKGEFEVDLRTFNTGVELRNDFIRDKFLNAAEHPIATFTVTRLINTSKARLVDNVPVSLRVEGMLKARGTMRPQVILVKLVYLKESELTKQRLTGNLLKASASFDIDTALFNVQIPDNQRGRFARYVQVYVDAVGSDQSPSVIAIPPAPSPTTK